MKTRTLKTVKADIAKTEKELSGLRVELPKAKSRMMDIQVKRERVVYKAKTGNAKAQAKLAELNKTFDTAKWEKDDFETAIRQGEVKLQTLETELNQSKEEAGRDLIRDCGKEQEKCLARIAKAMDEVVAAVQESRKGTDALRKDLDALGFEELNLDSQITKVAVHSISQTLYGLFPRSGKFERPLSGYHRETALVQMVQNLFKRFYDSRKSLIENPEEGVIKADLSTGFRVVPLEEAEAQVALREKLKQEAETMRQVPA